MRKLLSLCAALSVGSGSALAAPSGTSSQISGSSKAVVVAPAAMSATAEMKFGQFVQPTGAGTLTLSPSGTMTGTGAVNGNQLIAQSSGGASPGAFQIIANTGQTFTVYGPITTTLSKAGGATMTITNLTGSLTQTATVGGNVYYTLNVGGTLNVGANQSVGTYTGSYTLTTIYL
jgi:hypothetical protein